MKKLPLSNTLQFALVDDEEYDRCKLYSWRTQEDKIIISGTFGSYNLKTLHKFIMNSNLDYDHKDRNFLNNQKENLRLANHQQNMFNRGKFNIKCTSIYKGVSWSKQANKWKVGIKVNKKSIYFGYFKQEFNAAQAYNFAADKYFGEFAVFNEVDLGQQNRNNHK